MDLNTEAIVQLEDAAAKKEPVFLSTPDLNMTFQTRILEISGKSLVLVNAVAPEFIRTFSSSSEFFLQVSSLKFHCLGIETDGEHILFPISKSSLLDDIRQEKRFSFANEKKVFCKILNPFDKKTILKRPVIDLSNAGISIRNLYESKLFQTGVQLPDLKIFVDSELHASHQGEVVYSRILMNQKKERSVQVGIKFL